VGQNIGDDESGCGEFGPPQGSDTGAGKKRSGLARSKKALTSKFGVAPPEARQRPTLCFHDVGKRPGKFVTRAESALLNDHQKDGWLVEGDNRHSAGSTAATKSAQRDKIR